MRLTSASKNVLRWGGELILAGILWASASWFVDWRHAPKELPAPTVEVPPTPTPDPIHMLLVKNLEGLNKKMEGLSAKMDTVLKVAQPALDPPMGYAESRDFIGTRYKAIQAEKPKDANSKTSRNK